MKLLRPQQGGYTIIEVVIVLTVSAALFAITVLGYTQQNRRTQYTESVETFAQRLRDVLNDVETGFYPPNEGFTCVIDGSGKPAINPAGMGGGNEQGTNEACVFLGRALQFNQNQVNIYTVVGKRYKNTDGLSRDNQIYNLADATPEIIQADEGVVDSFNPTAELNVLSVTPLSTASDNEAAFAIISNQNAATLSSGFNTRSQLVYIPDAFSVNGATLSGKVNALTQANVDSAQSGFRICLDGDNRLSSVTIGSNGSTISVSTKIDTDETECPTP